MASKGRATILVCDDEPHIVQVVAAKLRNAEYDVVTAADGEEALESAMRDRPTLVVTDYQMPGFSGLELARRLKQCPQTQTLPLVLLTARGLSLDRSELADTNIRVMMCKPFSPREILATVQQILGEAAAPAGNMAGAGTV